MTLIPSHWLTRALALTLGALLLGCSSPRVEDYSNDRPRLDMRRYFNGTLDAYGMFQDRSGRVVKRFHVLMQGSWEGNQGVLDERFTYADGSTERRVWRLQLQDDGRLTGRADDVVGQASGRVAGNALQWAYTLRLPVDGTVYEVQFDDWMFLLDERVMLNRAVMSKWGFRLGEVTLSFVKRAPY